MLSDQDSRFTRQRNPLTAPPFFSQLLSPGAGVGTFAPLMVEEKKTKEQQLIDQIKECEELINEICKLNPNPITVIDNIQKIRIILNKAFKIATPLAKKKKRELKIKEQIEKLSEDPNYKWSTREKKFIKKVKKPKIKLRRRKKVKR